MLESEWLVSRSTRRVRIAECAIRVSEQRIVIHSPNNNIHDKPTEHYKMRGAYAVNMLKVDKEWSIGDIERVSESRREREREQQKIVMVRDFDNTDDAVARQ